LLLISYVLTGEPYSGSRTTYTKTKRYNTTWHLAFKQHPVSPYRVTNESWMPKSCSGSKSTGIIHLSNIHVNRNRPWKEVAICYLRIYDWVTKFLTNYMKGGVVINATFSNISAISWRSVLFVEETRIPGENHRPVASHWQTLSHTVVSSTPRLSGIRTIWMAEYSLYIIYK